MNNLITAQGQTVAFDLYPHKVPVNMPPPFNPCNHFLPHIASLLKTQGVPEPCLNRYRILSYINAVFGDSGFNSQSFHRIETNRATGYSASLLAPYAGDPAALAARVDRDAKRMNWHIDKAKGIV